MYKLKIFKLVLAGKISFKYWLKFNASRVVWVYDGRNISVDNENMYDINFGLTLIGEDLFRLPNGTIFRQKEEKGIYLLENGKLLASEIKNNKLEVLKKEQIILNLPKTQVLRLKNKAKAKKVSLNDYLLQQINSLL